MNTEKVIIASRNLLRYLDVGTEISPTSPLHNRLKDAFEEQDKELFSIPYSDGGKEKVIEIQLPSEAKYWDKIKITWY